MVVQYTWGNEGFISDILRLDPITAGFILLNVKLVAPKRENSEPILTVRELNRGNSLNILFLVLRSTHPGWAKNIYFVHIDIYQALYL